MCKPLTVCTHWIHSVEKQTLHAIADIHNKMYLPGTCSKTYYSKLCSAMPILTHSTAKEIERLGFKTEKKKSEDTTPFEWFSFHSLVCTAERAIDWGAFQA